MKNQLLGDGAAEQTLANRSSLSVLRPWLNDPVLYRVTRRSIAAAMAIGLALMWLPLPVQTLLAGACAIQWRANLPLSASLVWITNPLTIPPMYFGAYQVGSILIGPTQLDTENWATLLQDTHGLWLPLLTGCSVLAVVFACLGYAGTYAFWRLRALYRLTQWRTRAHRPSD